MAWNAIPYSNWEYNDSPVEPPVTNEGQHALWAQQTNGIRTVTYPGGGTVEIYTECRLVGTTVQTMGELNKNYWDAVALQNGGALPWQD